jgi:hypothetical protein
MADYKYSLEECDIPECRKRMLSAYREFRSDCIRILSGDPEVSVFHQIRGLCWQSAVFKTLNEARRIEHPRRVNAELWELATIGYGLTMALGVRKLVDKEEKTNSLRIVLNKIEKRPELLTREFYVCHDGLPFDADAAERRYYESITEDFQVTRWHSFGVKNDYHSSRILHQKFDALSGKTDRGKRLDKIDLTAALKKIKADLDSPPILKIKTSVDKVIAHAERSQEAHTPALHQQTPMPTYDEIDAALETLIRIANFISFTIFYDSDLGTPVSNPLFDVFEKLECPWISEENLPLLTEHWHSYCEKIDKSTENFEATYFVQESQEI